MAAENVALPVKAEYTTGRGGAQVLLDPCGFELAFKRQEGMRKFYRYLERKTTGCKVSVSLDVNTDMIVRVMSTW